MSRKRGIESQISEPSKKARTDDNNDMPDLEPPNSPPYVPSSPPYSSLTPYSNAPQLLEPQQANADVIRELTNLGEQITTFFNSNSETLDAPREQYEGIKNNVLQVLENVFLQHQNDLVRLRQEREANNLQMIAEENNRMLQELRQGFLTNIQQVTNNLTNELTMQEQATLYKEILDFIHNKQSDAAYIREIQNEPDHLNRFAEIINIAYNYSLEQMAITLSGIKTKTPEVTRQTVAVITSSLLLYNYQPAEVREIYNNIPYFGHFFQIMNQSNDILKIVSNSAGTVTTIYYLLRNAGIDVNSGLSLVRNMATTVTPRVVSSVSTVSQATVSATGRILNYLGGRLGSLLTTEYIDLEIPLTDSQGTEGTAITAESMLSYVSVNELLNEPIANGGIELNQNLTSQEQSIIEERFNAIISGDESNPIIATSIETAVVEEVTTNVSLSQSTVSDISNMSEDTLPWHQWLYGSSTSGGRRRRRFKRFSRRVKRVSRRMRRRGRKTRKGKRRYKTLKKH